MFKSRSGSQGNASTPPPQSIEAVRRRARHRLIGASVLVLLGVIGFPVLFDTQPRPIPVDIPIEIPARHTPAPVAKPAASASSAPAAKPPAAASAALPARDGLGSREEVVEASPKPAPVAAPVPAPVAAAPAPAAPPPAPAKPATPSPAEADRARALLEGKPPAAPASAAAKPAASAERLVVQVGAFSEAAGARAVRQKLEGAGLKTYVHEAQTPDGKRIRVRVGPFENRADADKAAARVKALGLPAAVLTL
jgi:DedD protein